MNAIKIATLTTYSHTDEQHPEIHNATLWEKFNTDPCFHLNCQFKTVDEYGVTRIVDVLAPVE